jgi:hypothetical protein
VGQVGGTRNLPHHPLNGVWGWGGARRDPATRVGRGTCDRCHEAKYLLLLLRDRTNADLAACWRDYFRLSLELFDTLAFRFHLHRVATALHKRTLLRRSDVDALLDVKELVAARERLAEGVT